MYFNLKLVFPYYFNLNTNLPLTHLKFPHIFNIVCQKQKKSSPSPHINYKENTIWCESKSRENFTNKFT
jgi:hypothetical protein